MVTVFYSFLSLFLLYLFALMPKRHRKIEKGFYTHRGHHTMDQSVPENTLQAFKRSMDHAYGIELDVQLSKDGVVYVFHDDDLKRLFGDERLFESMLSEEIDRLRLNGEKIPRFQEVLELVSGRVPWIVELKSCKRYRQLSDKTMNLLKHYQGTYVVESFDPRVIVYFRRKYPEIIRGFLIMETKRYDKPKLAHVLTSLFLNLFMRCDFIAIEKKLYDKHWPSKVFKALGGKLVLWTIHKSDKIEEEIVIFEYFEPRGL